MTPKSVIEIREPKNDTKIEAWELQPGRQRAPGEAQPAPMRDPWSHFFCVRGGPGKGHEGDYLVKVLFFLIIIFANSQKSNGHNACKK